MRFDLELNPTDPAEVAQLMDEHHLVVLGSDRAHRQGFAAGLIEHLEAMSDTEVIRVGGPRDGSFAGLCRQLTDQLEWRSGGRAARCLVRSRVLEIDPFDQKRRIEELGGEAACRDAPAFNHTPAPGA